MVDNADMERTARMVAETQRVRVRLLWDDQKMRQSMAAAYGLDRLGKSMAAAYGLDRLGKSMATAAGLDKVGKTMAAAHRERMRPLFNTPKFVGPMFGGEFQRIAHGMADAYQVPVRPRFDVQDVFDVAQGIVDATIVVPSNASTGSLTVVDGSVPAEGPLFPGLMNPWQQVRCWDLQDWIAFLTFVVTVAGLVVAMGQSRPQVGLSPEDLEKVIRTIQESDRPNTSKLVPNSTNTPTRATSTRSLDGEKGPAPTACPSPTSG